MKTFDFLLCFLLCALPYLFTVSCTSEHEMELLSQSMGITLRDLQECLNKSQTDWDTIKELSRTIYIEDEISQYPQEMVKKISCVSACIYRKNGVLVNSKIVPEKLIQVVSHQSKNLEQLPDNVRRTILECNERAHSETDDCKVLLTFSRCFVQEMKRQ